MDDSNILDIPAKYKEIEAKCKEIGFTMPSDMYVGTLLKTLVSSKPNGNFLELGTGIGLSLAWMEEGMDDFSKLITVDNDPELSGIAKSFFGEDEQIEIVCADGTEWLMTYDGELFDLVFADAWPGKYSELNEVLDVVNLGGFYVIDDMLPQPNWPEGHAEKAEKLMAELEARNDLVLTKMNWSTGVVVCVKIS
ncbi:class I SAM-dependent methyltransferase [Flammeovirgaceae bacterium SG7u.111]|nr:class I SAM-dependent methyltransferase [Flammeovirgaceae bacterium SG7u.132]WPO36849.1 class I SAM-dependent methyltransferase [Flammeovirgaceae bacterium SG7u.111]